MVLGLGLSSQRFLRFVRSARFLRGARRGPARPYLLAFSAHHPRPSSPPSRTHVLSCARRARSPPRWRQERLFNTLRWRCAAPAVTASCAASRLAERERRSTRHGTAPNIPRRARVLPALCPQSLLLTLSPRVSCAARPHVRRPSAARERSALWWRREMVCHMTWVLRRRRLPGAPLTSCITSGGTSDRAYVCLAHPVKGAILFARRRIARQHIARRRAKSLRAYRWPNLVNQRLALADFRALVAGAATAGAHLLPVGQRCVCGASSRDLPRVFLARAAVQRASRLGSLYQPEPVRNIVYARINRSGRR